MGLNRQIATSGALWLLAMAGPAFGAAPRLDVPAQPLDRGLAQPARALGIELLFDSKLVATRQGHATHAATPEAALSEMLEGTPLTWRRTSAGAYVVAAQFAQPAAAVVAPTVAISEILVVGRRTQNIELARSQDDIQPYQVLGAAEIQESQAYSVEGLLRARQSANAQQVASNLAPSANGGSNRSQIDLRGLGVDETLVLIDGRRIASPPTSVGFGQPDLNALPLGALTRVDTLGASAGGIFGIGAAGGAVNVVLKRDFDGFELNGGSEISARGDGWRRSLALRFGATSADGNTRLMISGGVSRDDGLELGDRGFIAAARALHISRSAQTEFVASPSINFFSITGAPLIFSDVSGGGPLGGASTYLPFAAPALSQGGLAILRANAGTYDTRLSPDGQGDQASLITPSQTAALVGVLRRDLTDELEVYLDGLWLRDAGRAPTPALATNTNVLFAGQAGNPFTTEVGVTFPTPGLLGQSRDSNLAVRGSAGLIVRLPGSWSANLDFSSSYASEFKSADKPAVRANQFDPTLGGAALLTQLSGLAVSPNSSTWDRDRLDDFNLRIAGPVTDLAGGPLTLTLAAEHRREVAPGEVSTLYFSGQPNIQRAAPTRQIVDSLFLETRAPLTSTDGGIGLIRGLEVQAALRSDRYDLTVAPGNGSGFNGVATAHDRATITAETLGFRVRPSDGLTLRASVSNGATPPTPPQLVQLALSGAPASLNDPRRGGSQAGIFSPFYTLLLGGEPSLRPQSTLTASIGAVFTPAAAPGLRLSIDYTRLRTTGEITSFASADAQYFLVNEARFSTRIVRAPLTAADAAKGFTGGTLVSIDTGALQVGRSILQAVDIKGDYQRAFAGGRAHAYGQMSWEPSFRRIGDPTKPAYDLVDHADGPLSVRGNIGLDWSKGRWTSGVNLQVFGGYDGHLATPINVLQSSLLGSPSAAVIAASNTSNIPAQAYLDGSIVFRPRPPTGGGLDVEYRAGIRNVLNAQPPVVAGTLATQLRNEGLSTYDYNPEGGYSPYGDARGRRFVVSITARY